MYAPDGEGPTGVVRALLFLGSLGTHGHQQKLPITSVAAERAFDFRHNRPAVTLHGLSYGVHHRVDLPIRQHAEEFTETALAFLGGDWK